MTGRYVAAVAAYITAVTGIACTATWAASLLPISSPIGAWAASATAGCFATLAATSRLPYPCTCHRKDQP